MTKPGATDQELLEAALESDVQEYITWALQKPARLVGKVRVPLLNGTRSNIVAIQVEQDGRLPKWVFRQGEWYRLVMHWNDESPMRYQAVGIPHYHAAWGKLYK